MQAATPTLPSSPELDKAERLAELAALIDQRHTGAERTMLATFCAGYFQQADPDDVVPQTAENTGCGRHGSNEEGRRTAPGS